MKTTSAKIFIQQVQLLHASSILPLCISIFAGGLLCWLLWGVADQTVLSIWFALFLTISVTRLYHLLHFGKKLHNSGNVGSWYKQFLIGAYGAAGTWGSASLFMFPEHHYQHQIVFLMIMAGLSAGAVSSLCSSLPAISGFLSLLLIPLSFRMMLLENSMAHVMGLLVILFLIANIVGAIKINRNIRDTIELRLQSAEREKKFSISEERYRHLFNSAPLGVFQYDADSVIIDCNNEFVNIVGSSRKKLIGLNMLEKINDQEMTGAIRDSLSRGEGYFEGEYPTITSNKTIPVRVFLKSINPSGKAITGGVGIVEDFTERKLAEQRVQHHASYDFLTDLPNRRLLTSHLTGELARARRYGYHGGLLFIDLDNFKTINDSLGHSMGDELLKLVAKRILDCIRQEDSAARMGGDEFVIILTQLDKNADTAAGKARKIAEELALCLSAPCTIKGHEIHITISIGISLFPESDKGVDDILKQADTAMYEAKSSGRNTIHFFLPSMQEAADERLRLSTDIRKALENNELVLYYQAQVNSTGIIVGAEALLRWEHPEKGMIPPDAFLSVAEETGQMWDIGRWVLRSTCDQIRKWSDAGLLEKNQTISLNISGKEFSSPDFVNVVTGIIEETGINPLHLGIELTEHSLVSTESDVIEKIMTLREWGIKFSVDDFGTGYSSLSYLKMLPLNTLKIDRSFVSDISDVDGGVVLVDTIIMMAHNLELNVIAEGVETKQELLYLETKGCTVYQGYYFSKPVPEEAFTEQLIAKKLANPG